MRMKREERYNKRYFKKIQLGFVVVVFFSVFFMTFFGLLLNKHLFYIQSIERISKLREYDKYSLKLRLSTSCDKITDKLVYKNDNIDFYISCLDEVYVLYGSTPTTLSYAMKNDYLTLDILKKNSTLEKYDDYNKYIDNTNNVVMYEFFEEETKVARVYLKAL